MRFINSEYDLYINQIPNKITRDITNIDIFTSYILIKNGKTEINRRSMDVEIEINVKNVIIEDNDPLKKMRELNNAKWIIKRT